MCALVFTMVGIRVFGVTAKRSKPIEADEATSATVQRSDVAHDGATTANGPHSGRGTNADAAAYHDFHHSGNRGNFGALWCDWSFGTMDAYVALGGMDGYIAQCKQIGEDNAKKGN